MPISTIPARSSGEPTGTSVQDSTRRGRRLRRFLQVAILYLFITTLIGAPLDSRRARITRIVVQIQQADFKADQAALKRHYDDLAPFADDKEFGARVRYWRGFAQWRRAINGFNDQVDAGELELDIRQAISEFQAAISKDSAFADAKAATGSSMGLLFFLHMTHPALVPELNDQGRLREFLQRALSYVDEARTADPENPRVLWIVGQNQWVLPRERGGGQDKAFETYQKGLTAARNRKGEERDALMPSWGEPELLMNLAWSNLNRTTPDVAAAEKYARSALALVPNWHYVRDILLPQILAAKAKQG